MSVPKKLWAGLFAAVAVLTLDVSPAHADPLTPLTPNEIQYLDSLHKVFAASHDPAAFRSDGELLTLGEYVCTKAHAGQVGQDVTFTSPAINQLALIYLCP